MSQPTTEPRAMAEADGARQPRRSDAIIAISSHVARGTVGNRASAHAIEALGHPVWSVPTVLLPWHPGQGPGTRLDWPQKAFAALLGDLSRSPHLQEVGAILSGYLGGAEQTDAIAALVRAAKGRRSTLYCCDPVIGNAGGRYVPKAMAEAIRDTLLPLADIATPNRFELEWLSARAVPDDPGGIAAIARRLGPPMVLVTSAQVEADRIATLLVTPREAFVARHRRIDAPNSGTGDLTAGLFLARTLEGERPERALGLALAGAVAAMEAEAALDADELPLERIHDRLRLPDPVVAVERIE